MKNLKSIKIMLSHQKFRVQSQIQSPIKNSHSNPKFTQPDPKFTVPSKIYSPITQHPFTTLHSTRKVLRLTVGSGSGTCNCWAKKNCKRFAFTHQFILQASIAAITGIRCITCGQWSYSFLLLLKLAEIVK